MWNVFSEKKTNVELSNRNILMTTYMDEMEPI